MNQQHSLLYAIVNNRCPRCREGKMFPKGTLYTPRFADMHPNCSKCGQTFEPEPGYYFGAMYVSFGINVGIFLGMLFILSQLVEEITTTMMISLIVGVVVGFLPVIFRISRAIWINIFIHYEAPAAKVPE